MTIIIGGGEIANTINKIIIDSEIIVSKKPSIVKHILNNVYKEKNIKNVIITSGYLEKSNFKKMTFNNIDKTISANLTFPIKIANIVQDKLKKSNGKLIVFSSSTIFGTREEYSVYAATKIGLEKFIENFSSETGIKTLIVRNGRTDTKLRWNNYKKTIENKKNLLSTKEVAIALKNQLEKDCKILDIFKDNEYLNISIDRKN